ncbi:hypothetical protein D3C72_2485550 [compost metagenome]
MRIYQGIEVGVLDLRDLVNPPDAKTATIVDRLEDNGESLILGEGSDLLEACTNLKTRLQNPLTKP